MSKRDYILFLEDILKSSEKILSYTGEKSYEEFVRDEMLVDATVRNLEIIGGAVKNLPAKVKQKHSNAEWEKIAGLRNILIHEYFEINYKILWDIVKNKIPQLKESMLVILKAEKK